MPLRLALFRGCTRVSRGAIFISTIGTEHVKDTMASPEQPFEVIFLPPLPRRELFTGIRSRFHWRRPKMSISFRRLSSLDNEENALADTARCRAAAVTSIAAPHCSHADAPRRANIGELSASPRDDADGCRSVESMNHFLAAIRQNISPPITHAQGRLAALPVISDTSAISRPRSPPRLSPPTPRISICHG